MRGVDTNILVRHFVDEDDPQKAVAREFLNSLTPEDPGYVSTVALMEMWWVLSKIYDMERAGLIRAIGRMLANPHFRVEHDAEVAEAVDRFAMGTADFQDYLIERRCSGAGCLRTMTFDRGAANSAGMTLIGHNPIDAPAPRSVSTPSTAKIAAAMA
ncbi:putative nucleic-acid-binding protein [Mitsuaria sp. BK045]|uniref:PIN domain-containing protein n=1 Tax=unclassified Roseateles TaxID=2626991 RepID=UPI001619A1E2|nr:MULTISPECIES: type II toxin-antitoxin system VapC family toxin [unclassified Roseateles]MBB3295626.1 putative nucleic-acid-binding protein [Mitsuaria sp. BK041]MBB3364842.1 putative nucleic-acid-binding protein [Mitsuaria sp. BK045]